MREGAFSSLRSRVSGGRPNLSFWGALIVVLALVQIALFANRACLSLDPDGAGWQTYIDYQWFDRAPFSQKGTDALQGSFDAWYPLFIEYTLPGIVAHALLSGPPQPLFIYSVYAILIGGVAFLFCRTSGKTRAFSLLAAFCCAIILLPVVRSHPIVTFRYLRLNPHWAHEIALTMLMLWAFLKIDGRRSIGQFALLVAPAALLTIEIAGVGAMVIFSAPVALYGSVILARSRTRAVFGARVLCVAIALVVVVLNGEAAYLYSLVRYSAYSLFGREFDVDPASLASESLFFSTQVVAQVVLAAGWFGSLLAAMRSTNRDWRVLALAHLIATTAWLVFCGAFYVWNRSHAYTGSPLLYFEAVMIPFAVLFAADLLVRLIGSLSARVGRGQARAAPLMLAGTVGVFIAIEAVAGAGENTCRANQVYSAIKPNAITDLLSGSIALAPGKPFEGIAATIDDPRGAPSVSFVEMNRNNGHRFAQLGNDLRISGLWRYNIPTLYQYFTFITAPYYFALTEFLARATDQQTRSGLILSRIDAQFLRLIGVRFVLTDQPSAEGQERARLDGGELPIRLMDLGSTNRGDYSPTNILVRPSFATAAAAMHAAGFDPTTTAVTMQPVEGPLVAATATHMIYTKSGFHLSAKSQGRSLLVLPAQYSHCWSIGDEHARLVRVDLMLLGVAFSGQLEADLDFTYGPFSGSACRLADIADARTFDLANGRPPRSDGAHGSP